MKKLFVAVLMLSAVLFLAPAAQAGSPTKVLKQFAERATNADWSGVLTLLDGNYKQTQLIEFHKGDTMRFLNELFCGTLKSDPSKFICPGIAKVLKVKYAGCGKTIKESEVLTRAEAKFSVTTRDGQVFIMKLSVLGHTQGSGKTLYRLAGAVG